MFIIIFKGIFFLVLVVVPVYHKNNGKRNYSKPSYWHYFERKFISNIKKHYVKCHIDKEAVKNMVQAEEGVAKGHRDCLVNLGNYKYTKKVNLLNVNVQTTLLSF